MKEIISPNVYYEEAKMKDRLIRVFAMIVTLSLLLCDMPTIYASAQNVTEMSVGEVYYEDYNVRDGVSGNDNFNEIIDAAEELIVGRRYITDDYFQEDSWFYFETEKAGFYRFWGSTYSLYDSNGQRIKGYSELASNSKYYINTDFEDCDDTFKIEFMGLIEDFSIVENNEPVYEMIDYESCGNNPFITRINILRDGSGEDCARLRAGESYYGLRCELLDENLSYEDTYEDYRDLEPGKYYIRVKAISTSDGNQIVKTKELNVLSLDDMPKKSINNGKLSLEANTSWFSIHIDEAETYNIKWINRIYTEEEAEDCDLGMMFYDENGDYYEEIFEDGQVRFDEGTYYVYLYRPSSVSGEITVSQKSKPISWTWEDGAKSPFKDDCLPHHNSDLRRLSAASVNTVCITLSDGSTITDVVSSDYFNITVVDENGDEVSTEGKIDVGSYKIVLSLIGSSDESECPFEVISDKDYYEELSFDEYKCIDGSYAVLTIEEDGAYAIDVTYVNEDDEEDFDGEFWGFNLIELDEDGCMINGESDDDEDDYDYDGDFIIKGQFIDKAFKSFEAGTYIVWLDIECSYRMKFKAVKYPKPSEIKIEGFPTLVYKEVSLMNVDLLVKVKYSDGDEKSLYYPLNKLLNLARYNERLAESLKVSAVCDNGVIDLDEYGQRLDLNLSDRNFKWVIKDGNGNVLEEIRFEADSIVNCSNVISPGQSGKKPAGSDKLGYDILCVNIPTSGQYTFSVKSSLKTDTWYNNICLYDVGLTEEYLDNEFICLSKTEANGVIYNDDNYTLDAGYYYVVKDGNNGIEEVSLQAGFPAYCGALTISNVKLISDYADDVFLDDMLLEDEVSLGRFTAVIRDVNGNEMTTTFMPYGSRIRSFETGKELRYDIRTADGNRIYPDEDYLECGDYIWKIWNWDGSEAGRIPFKVVDKNDFLDQDFVSNIDLKTNIGNLDCGAYFYKLIVPNGKKYELKSIDSGYSVDIFLKSGSEVVRKNLAYYNGKIVLEAGIYVLSGEINLCKLTDVSEMAPKISSVTSTATGLTLKWNKVENAIGYEVYRKSGSSSYSKIATVTGGATVTYTDKTAKSGVTYTYALKTKYSSKTSSLGTGVAQTFVARATITSISGACEKAVLTWGAVSGADSYKIYRKTGSEAFTLVATVKGKTTYTDTKVKAKTNYSYKIVALKGSKASADSALKTVTISSHTYSKKTTPATTSKNGKIVSTCSKCKHAETTVIYAATSITLSLTETVYTGKDIKPTVKILDSKKKAVASSNYTVAYKNNKAIGKATVTITFKGNYSGTVTKTFTIKPGLTQISTVKPSSKAFAVTVKAPSGIDGYELQYATSSNFKSAKTVKTKGNKATTVKSLKSKTTYYVRVRSYKVVKEGTKSVTYYSDWSVAKNVVVK